jgi:hypothetical protein
VLGKAEEEPQPGRQGPKREDNIKVNVEDTDGKDVDFIELTQKSVYSRNILNMVMNHLGYMKAQSELWSHRLANCEQEWKLQTEKLREVV